MNLPWNNSSLAPLIPNPAVSNGQSAPKDGVDIHGSGNYSEMGVAYTSAQLRDGILPSGSEASPILRWITSHVPTVNALSVFHDATGGAIDRAGYWNTFTNYGTMIPAAVITEAAIFRGNTSVEYALHR